MPARQQQLQWSDSHQAPMHPPGLHRQNLLQQQLRQKLMQKQVPALLSRHPTEVALHHQLKQQQLGLARCRRTKLLVKNWHRLKRLISSQLQVPMLLLHSSTVRQHLYPAAVSSLRAQQQALTSKKLFRQAYFLRGPAVLVGHLPHLSKQPRQKAAGQ
jgi:hypothetical protein